MVGLNVKGEELSGEPTAALRFTGVQRAASVGAPPANPSQVLRSSAILLNRWGWFKKLVLGTDSRGISLWFVLIFRRSGGQLRLIEWRNLL